MKKYLKSKYIFVSFVVVTFSFYVTACNKNTTNSNNSTNSILQNKWTLISRTATFPASPMNNFHEIDSPNDYLNFGKNDTVSSYVTAYLPFSIDTAFYKVSQNTITFYTNNNQNGFIFQSQDTNGNWHDTTVVQILSLTENSMILSFPSIGTVGGSGPTQYYPGTEIDSLKR